MSEELTENQLMFLDHFDKNMGDITKTCRSMGVSRQSFYVWKNGSEKFAELVENVKEGLIDRAESELYDHMFQERSLDAIKYYLSRKGKNRGYVEKFENENKNEHTGTVAVICPPKQELADSVGNRSES